ncbi:hypothetical protein RSAG8_01366, partial [Rhizoctonia solani AG-8 WAC10335]
MQRKRSGASANVRFASESGSRRTTITSITEESSSARSSSIGTPVDTGRPIYEIWEPPEETVLDHYKPTDGLGNFYHISYYRFRNALQWHYNTSKSDLIIEYFQNVPNAV